MNPFLLARTPVEVSLSRLRVVLLASPAVILLVTGVASADSAASAPERATAPQKLGVSVATSYLGNAAGSGVAVSSGLRLALGTNAALSADLGYGVLSAPSATQDRWWIMPAIAWAIPAENVRFDIGAGLGLGASSGYASFADYTRGPFSPTWAFQLVPATRAHVMAAMPLGRDVDAFVRVEAAALLLSGTQLGFRNGNANPGLADTTWFETGAGVQFRLL
jgi:hypothetical protein